MGHFHSLLSFRKRSSDTSDNLQISEERPSKRPRLAQTSELDRPESSRALNQQKASTSRVKEWDDAQDSGKPIGYSSQQVFLSHSGKQKNFVEQLHMDLKRENITSFFDKDRESLPKGEAFPPLIFEAAKKCKVAVVVLSEDFITSKWPMLELCAFFDAKKTSNPSLKILPLFFEISPQTLSQKTENRDIYTSWVNSKNPHTKLEKRINLNAWFDALKALRPINGEIYNQVEGEIAYRHKIVDDIRRLLPRNLMSEGSSGRGNQRLCEEVEKLFQNTPFRRNRVKVAGLYGVGGSGKTTVCKSLCHFYSHDFHGKVFHVELQRNSCLETLKRALRILTGASKTLVNSVMSIEEGSLLLKDMMCGKKVFLAIDNISDNSESIKEAKLYMNAVSSGYESLILLTARSLGILRRLIPKEECSFMHVPGLEEEEAIAVLLQLTPVEVSHLTSVEKDVARKCIQKCCFTWYCGDDKQYRAYHPLALRTFGAYLYDKFESCADLSRWIEIPNLSNSPMGPMQEIFCMFEESLKGLSPEYLMVFMLLCLYLPKAHMTADSAFIWLALVCDIKIDEIEYVIIHLKNKGFIERGYKLYIHDLLMDFAESRVDGNGKWVSLKSAVDIPRRLQQELSNDRPRIEAMKLENCLFESLALVNYDLLSNVSVLHLQDMAILKTLDLRSMKMVRSIAIIECRELEEIKGIEGLPTLCYFIVEGCYTDLQFPGVGYLMALRHLEMHLEDSNGRSSQVSHKSFPPSRIGNLPTCEFLEYPKLNGLRNLRTIDLDYSGRGTGTLDLTGCSNLRTIQLTRCGMSRLNLTGCSELRTLDIRFCNTLSAPLDLDGLTDLQTLRLSQFQMALPNFDMCTRLTTLTLQMTNLEELPDLGGLTNLRTLWLSEMEKLKKLPSLSPLNNLSLVMLEEMGNLEELPSFTGLTNLSDLVLKGMPNLTELPSFTGLTNLSSILLEGMQNLKEIPSSLSGLTNLTELVLEGMQNLTELPNLSGLVNLTDLRLQEMESLRELPSLSGLTDLGTLWLRGMPNLKELPTFTELTNLCYLWLFKMKNLKELPCLCGLTNLNHLALAGMPNLKELPSLSELTSLDSLVLEGMRDLEELPSLKGMANLSSLELGSMRNLKKMPTLSGLTDLGRLEMMNMPKLEELPTLTDLTNLSELAVINCGITEPPDLTNCHQVSRIVIRKCEKLSRWPTISGLTALRTFSLTECKELAMHPDLSGCPRYIDLKVDDHIEWRSTYTSQWI